MATRLASHFRAVTWLLLFVGVAGSVFAGAAWRSSVQGQDRRAFAEQTSEVASSVSVSLSRLDDLTAAMRTVVATHPKTSASGWNAWVQSLDVTKRYPASLGLAYAELVPANKVKAYAAAVKADPPSGTPSNQPFTITPPGLRPSYCFLRLKSAPSVLDVLPDGLDLCEITSSGFLTKARDTGQFEVTPVTLGTESAAAIFAPVYRGGVVPATVALRRARIIGLAGGLFNVATLLNAALHSHTGLSARLLRQDIGASTPAQTAAAGEVRGVFGQTRGAEVGTAGAIPTRAVMTDTVTFNSDGQWTIEVLTSDAAAERKASTQGLIVFGVGLLLTLLAFALMRLLVRGRQGALDLVTRRTAELSTSESRFRSLATASPMGVLQTDVDGRFLYGNGRLGRILGRTPAQLDDRSWLDGFSTTDQERVLANLHRSADGPTGEVDARLHDRGDDEQWVRFSSARILKDGELTGYVSSVEDVSEEIASTERLRYEAQHDSLTGLPNRAYFLELVDHALQDLAANDGQFAVLFIDLDRFKQVNDTHGHAAGDELLVATAGRIANSLRPGDRVARLGGDEFAVLMTDVTDLSMAALVVDRLQLAVAVPFAVGGSQAVVGASVGLVLVDDATGDPSAILQDADMAMYRAKGGSSRFEVFDDSLRTTILARFETEQTLRNGIERDELRLAYQPIIRLESGDIAGGEALLRWQHPTRGLLLPGDFLPLAESTGLIVPIGDWTMRTAVQAASGWPTEDLLRVSINFSAQQLTATNLLPTVEELLASNPIDPAQICVEVLETHLIDNANVGVLRGLKRLGVRIAIDDFGSGYSSLLYLKRMPADTVKIDRALIADLPERHSDRVIVAKVVELAHELGITVIAEGIERAEQAEILRDLGCDFGQGFAWSPAVPQAEFEQLLITGVPLVTYDATTP